MRYLLSLALIFALSGCSNEASTDSCRTDCCKICVDSKPCGDTCISSSNSCQTYGGCACYEYEACPE